ncbi:hypothetical protein BH09PLA1_BH09PLA1_00750 [soil metagenome]
MQFIPLQFARAMLCVFPACFLIQPNPAAALSDPHPTTRPADDLKSWFTQLCDPNPDVRDRARTKLMTMPRSRLNELQSLVAQSRPLRAAQAVELRPIVEHVYLSGEEYFSDKNGPGFLGVELDQISVPESDSGDESSNATGRLVQRVMVRARFPGFGAYPALRDGDVILSVVGSNEPLTKAEDLQLALIGIDPRKTIELEIQRAGQLIHVPVRLSPRPFFLTPGNQAVQNPRSFTAERKDAAAKYWDDHFANLLDRQTM